eukprot:jgi/Botrbrau1/3017/Bobra.0070s0013.1
MAEAGQGNNALQAPPLWDLGACAKVAFIAALGVQPPGITFFSLLLRFQTCMPLKAAAETLERLLRLGLLLEDAEGLLLPGNPAAVYVRNMTELDLSTGPPGQLGLGFLKRLPEEIGQLTALQQLNLSGCECMRALPEEIGRLTALQQLNLSGCKALILLPPELGRLGALRQLDLSECWGLSSLPAELAQLTALEVLNLSGCAYLRALPEEIGELTSLRRLDLRNCSELRVVPLSLRKVESLEELDVTGCKHLPMTHGKCFFWVEDIQHSSTGWEVARQVEIITRCEAAMEELTTYRGPKVSILEKMSWPAILLATATFIGFMQPPWPLGGCAGHFLLNSTNKETEVKDREGSQMYRCDMAYAFFFFDATSFSWCIASIMLIIVACTPRNEMLQWSRRSEARRSRRSEARRFWLLMYSAWQALYLALISGCVAFCLSGVVVWDWFMMLFAVYPAFFFLVSGFYLMNKHLWSLYPGFEPRFHSAACCIDNYMLLPAPLGFQCLVIPLCFFCCFSEGIQQIFFTTPLSTPDVEVGIR